MLICDKRRPRMRGDTNIRPPQGGQIRTDPPGLRPAPKALPAWGGTPRPPGLRPLARLRAPGPRCLGHPAGGGSGHRCAGGGGGQPLAVVHARRLAPGGFRASGEIQSVGRAVARRGVRGACPRKGGGGQPGPGGGRPGCSRLRLCPPSTDWARLSTGDRATGHTCLVEL